MTDFHGTLYGYTRKRCRCDLCRTAKSVYDGDRYDRNPREGYRPPQLFNRDGQLCCLICLEAYADHPLTKSCYREAAWT